MDETKEKKILKNDPFNNKMDISNEKTHEDIHIRAMDTELSENKNNLISSRKETSTLNNSNTTNDNENRIAIQKSKFIYKFVGKTLFIFSDNEGNPIFIIGPHWGMYFCLNGIITIIMILIYIFAFPKFNILMRILGHISFWFFFISYTLAFLLNPGYPKNNIGKFTGEPRKKYYFCEFCQFWIRKDAYASHCYDCDICIEGHDHHCPWTGHCIGKNNKIFFHCFLFSIISVIGYFAAAITNFFSN